MLTSIWPATLSDLFISSLPASSRQSVLAALFNSYVFSAAPASWRPEAIAVDPDRWWRGAAPLLYYWFFLERPKDDLLEFVPIEDRI